MTNYIKTITKLLINFNVFLQLNAHIYYKRLIPQNVSLRVYNGIPVKRGELPYQVAIMEKHLTYYDTFCGGSIIGQSKVLTAAHCLEDFDNLGSFSSERPKDKHLVRPLEGTFAVAGIIRSKIYRYESDALAQWRKFRSFTFHHKYNFPHYDIGILTLSEPFIYNQFVKPIKLASKEIDYKGYCLVSGYGQISTTEDSELLLKANLRVLPSSWCNESHKKDMSDLICTSLVEADIGSGDSGGPLVCRNTGDLMEKDGVGVLVGIACATYGDIHSVFTRVSRSNHITGSRTWNVDTTCDKWGPCKERRCALPGITSICFFYNDVGDESCYRAQNKVAIKAMISRSSKLYKTVCGATIIQPAKLLSAAHCFHTKGGPCRNLFNPGYERVCEADPDALRSKFAVAGILENIAVYGKDPDGQWRTMTRATYPSKYVFPKHDISVVFLQSPFIYNSLVGPIPIATRNVDYYGQCLVSGFGRTGQKETDQSSGLLMANLVLVPKKPCNKLHRKNMDNFVCTSSSLTDVGKGDSGGPLVCAHTGDPYEKDKGVLVGVVSGHSVGKGSFFTRVSKYKKFIENAGSAASYSKPCFQSYTFLILGFTYRTVFLF